MVPTVAPMPTSGEAASPWVGPRSFFHVAFLNFVPWYFEAVCGPVNGRMAAHDLRGTLRRTERLMEPPHTTVPNGWLLRGGGRGNHDHDSQTNATPCIIIRDVRNVTFRAVGSPLRRLTLTEERDLGPFVSVWVC
jgi:hypothetical protein